MLRGSGYEGPGTAGSRGSGYEGPGTAGLRGSGYEGPGTAGSRGSGYLVCSLLEMNRWDICRIQGKITMINTRDGKRFMSKCPITPGGHSPSLYTYFAPPLGIDSSHAN